MRNFKDAVWKENVSKVIQQIQEQEIKFIRLQFTDINGMLKNLAVSSKNLETIFDNGQSFDVEKMGRVRKGQHLGLLGMRERLEMVGCKLKVESTTGRGTTISAYIPFSNGIRGRALS